MGSRAVWIAALSVLLLGVAATLMGVPRLLGSGQQLELLELEALLPRILIGAGLVTAVLLSLATGSWMHARVSIRERWRAEDECEDAIEETQDTLRKLREDRVTFETRLAERTCALEDTIDEQIAFGDSVSHDLRSPLGNIVLSAEILRDDHGAELDQEATSLVGRVDSSARIALALLERLIAYSRVGRAALQVAPVDMRELVSSIFAELMLGHTGPRPRLALGPLPTISGDPDMLRSVWTNLLSNAMKFSRSRERPVIKVGVRQGAEADTFWVEDNGIGFLPSQGDRLFKTFQRLHRADGYEGHGLGLAIVRRIIERHGGKVWARGVPGKGAVLGFHLPTSSRDRKLRATRATTSSAHRDRHGGHRSDQRSDHRIDPGSDHRMDHPVESSS